MKAINTNTGIPISAIKEKGYLKLYASGNIRTTIIKGFTSLLSRMNRSLFATKDLVNNKIKTV
jgi:hypothetical protein